MYAIMHILYIFYYVRFPEKKIKPVMDARYYNIHDISM